MTDLTAYKAKLDNNAITIYRGADVFMTMPVLLSDNFKDTQETYFNRLTVPVNSEIVIPQADGSVFLILLIKRLPTLSYAIPTPSPLKVTVSSNRISPTDVGEFNTWSFVDGTKNLSIYNHSAYAVSVDILSVKNATTVSVVPGVPIFGLPTYTTTSVTLNWNPTTDGNSRIYQYIVGYRLTGTNGPYTYLDPQIDPYKLYCTVPNLTIASQYDFTVAAVNAVGTGLPALITATPSNVPAAVVITTPAAGDKQIVLNWLEPFSGGSPITSYTINIQSYADSNFLVAKTITIPYPTLTTTITGLVNHSVYSVSIVANNANGASYISVISNFLPLDPPVSPSIFNVGYNGSTLNLNYTAGTTSYTVLQVSRDQAQWSSLTYQYGTTPANTPGVLAVPRTLSIIARLIDGYFGLAAGTPFYIRLIDPNTNLTSNVVRLLCVAPIAPVLTSVSFIANTCRLVSSLAVAGTSTLSIVIKDANNLVYNTAANGVANISYLIPGDQLNSNVDYAFNYITNSFLTYFRGIAPGTVYNLYFTLNNGSAISNTVIVNYTV